MTTNRDPRLPPRPPKLPFFPRWFFDWGFWLVIGLNAIALALNGYFAYQGRATTWSLLMSCASLAFTVLTLGMFFHGRYGAWKNYSDVRKAFEESLDSIEAISIEILDGEFDATRAEYWERIGIVVEQLDEHMEGFRR